MNGVGVDGWDPGSMDGLPSGERANSPALSSGAAVSHRISPRDSEATHRWTWIVNYYSYDV